MKFCSVNQLFKAAEDCIFQEKTIEKSREKLKEEIQKTGDLLGYRIQFQETFPKV